MKLNEEFKRLQNLAGINENLGNNNLVQGTIDRMEGLSNTENLRTFKEMLGLLTKDWLEEGFEKNDIIDYIEDII